ncbi:MAG: hypothetical protein MJZ42_05230, partial [Bacteroidales bacterium]|nr:hypothetical protein [Bacteroidales bacterium]
LLPRVAGGARGGGHRLARCGEAGDGYIDRRGGNSAREGAVRGPGRAGCAGAGNGPPSPAKHRKGRQRRARAVCAGIRTAGRAISIGPSGSCLTVRRARRESRISKRGDAAFSLSGRR